MNALSRRDFLRTSTAIGVGVGTLLGSPVLQAAESEQKFTLGLVTYNIAKQWDLPTILRVCKEVGLGPIEFRTTHKHGVEPSLSKQQRKDVKKRCADAGIEIWGCGTACEFQDPDPSVVKKNIETCKRFVELTADIGGKGIKVRPNKFVKDVPIPKTLEQIGKALVPCGEAAKYAGVYISVEVHGRGTSEPKHMKTIMEQCGHPSVGVTWNSNPTEVKGGSIAEPFAMLSPWIKNVHINELANDAKGVYPYRELFRLLRTKGYAGGTLIEYGKVFPDEKAGTKFLLEYKALWQKLCQG